MREKESQTTKDVQITIEPPATPKKAKMGPPIRPPMGPPKVVVTDVDQPEVDHEPAVDQPEIDSEIDPEIDPEIGTDTVS